MTFDVGDKVRWVSTSGGYDKEKCGTVVRVVAAYGHPREAFTAAHQETGASFMGDFGLARDHESYIIHVSTPTGRGKGRLYWPRVKGLELA